MKSERKVSILIPCYNDGEFVEQAVQSALDQTYENKEVIVVDDGSDDEKTKSVLKTLSQKIDLLLIQENQGVVAARNNGIKEATGEYILTLDADDFFDKRFLEKAVPILNTIPEVGMVTCHATIINHDGKKYVQIPNGEDFNKAIFRNNVYASLLYRKKCWEDVNGYDPKMATGFEDWEFNISVSKAGWKVKVISEALFYYRLQRKSRNSSAKKNQKELREYVFKKHRDVGIKNYDETINFFLDEIEDLRKIIESYERSTSYRLGVTMLKPVRKLKIFFRF